MILQVTHDNKNIILLHPPRQPHSPRIPRPVPPRHIHVAPRQPLERILTVHTKYPITRLHLILMPTRDPRQRRLVQWQRTQLSVQTRVEKVRDRKPLAGRARLHTVHRRNVVAARGQLEHLASVDDERAGEGGGSDPRAGAVEGLQATGRVLKEQSEEAVVFVGADALGVR